MRSQRCTSSRVKLETPIQHALATLADHLADDLLGVAEAVDRRGVHPVDAGVEGPVQGRDGLVVVLRAPAERARAADGPGADAHDREARSVAAEVAELHVVVPPRCRWRAVLDRCWPGRSLPESARTGRAGLGGGSGIPILGTAAAVVHGEVHLLEPVGRPVAAAGLGTW